MTGGPDHVTIQCKGRVKAVRADETGEGGEGRGVACVMRLIRVRKGNLNCS